jgi:peptidoglycan/LPS O-acetylase OafA/YrhL
MAWWTQGVGNGTVSVDTFLLIGGLLVSYLLLKELERNKGKFNVTLFYLHRYLR